MEQHRCGNCLYYELDCDVLPCVECCKEHGNRTYSYWSPEVDKILDHFERMGTILKNQTYIMLEISRLRDKIDNLSTKE